MLCFSIHLVEAIEPQRHRIGTIDMNSSLNKTAFELTRHLNMTPHPEGGYFVETWRSAEFCQLPTLGRRNLGTSIYFLMPHGQVSKFHRLTADEIWHFYQGDPITVLTLDPERGLQKHLVGAIGTAHAAPQLIIPKGTWFGALHEDTGSQGYTLVGCTVSPGFEFQDFELAKRQQLLAEYGAQDSKTKAFICDLT